MVIKDESASPRLAIRMMDKEKEAVLKTQQAVN